MRQISRLTTFFLLLFCLPTFAQQNGFILATEALVGYNYISAIYQPDAAHAPANKGYNLAFQFGCVAGYKGKKSGILAEYKSAYFEQNMKQKDLRGDFSVRYNAVGARVFYQLQGIGTSNYFQTVSLGYLFLMPEQAHYLVKNTNGDVFGDTTQTGLLQNNHMITASYGITTGYKLLWAEFSVRAGYSLNNFYKPLTATKSKNFFIGVQLAFGLFTKTNF